MFAIDILCSYCTKMMDICCMYTYLYAISIHIMIFFVVRHWLMDSIGLMINQSEHRSFTVHVSHSGNTA